MSVADFVRIDISVVMTTVRSTKKQGMNGKNKSGWQEPVDGMNTIYTSWNL